LVLGARARLRGAAAFTGAHAVRLRGRYFTVSVGEGAVATTVQVGFVLAKKWLPRAVDRNYVKRRVRAELYRRRRTFAGWAVVVRLIAAPGPQFGAALSELASLLEQAAAIPGAGHAA
jgi:ribonuclease P protein component